LLPTEKVANKIRDMQARLLLHGPAKTKEEWAADAAQHQRLFGELQSEVTRYVIAQLEAEPQIGGRQMRGQLVRILNVKFESRDHSDESPCVFPVERPGEDSPKVWAVAYRGDAFPTAGGARSVVEAYVVENGKARLAGRGGREMDGCAMKAERFPDLANDSAFIVMLSTAYMSGRAAAYCRRPRRSIAWARAAFGNSGVSTLRAWTWS